MAITAFRFGTAFSPLDYAPALWLDDSGSDPSVWVDKSGNGRDATQSNTLYQPEIVPNTINGKQVRRFDGNTKNYSYPGGFFANISYSIFIIASRRSNKSNNYLLGGTSGSFSSSLIVGWRNNTTFTLDHYSSWLDGTVSGYTSPVFELFTCSYNSSIGRNIYKNNSIIATNTTLTSLTSNNGSIIGGWPLGASSYYVGDIAEIIIYPTALTAFQRQRVESYLNRKYAIY